MITYSTYSLSSHPLLHSFTPSPSFSLLSLNGMPLTVKFLPHEVADIEPTFEFLRKQDLRRGPWETRYMLLTWLSLMCMIPFDLRSIDSQASKDSERVCYAMGDCLRLGPLKSTKCAVIGDQPGSALLFSQLPLVDQMIETAKTFLDRAGKDRDASSLFLARLLTRYDTPPAYY